MDMYLGQLQTGCLLYLKQGSENLTTASAVVAVVWIRPCINHDLKQLDTWLQGTKLSLNVAKKSMLVSTKQKHNSLKSRNEDLDLKIRDNELEIIKKTKYLSVQIDNSLN